MYKGSEVVILDMQEQKSLLNFIKAIVREYSTLDAVPIPPLDIDRVRCILNTLREEVG